MARRLPSTRILLLLAALFGFGVFMTRDADLEACLREHVELGHLRAHGNLVGKKEEREGGESFEDQLQRVWNRDDLEGNEDHSWRDHNHHTLKALTICIATQTCRPNQDKVLILQDDHYRKALIGVPAGERIFARSLMKAFQQLGYTYLFAKEMGEVSAFYSLFPEQIRATIIHRNEYDKCYDDWERSCLKSKINPRGIPIQDLFTSQFFGRGAASPFAPWALVPEDIRQQNNTYIGYSIEEECVKQPFVPTLSRPRQVWLLGKVSKFFHGPYYPYSRDVWVKASKELNVEFIGAFDYQEGGTYPGVRNLQLPDGPLVGKEEFDMEISRSLAIIGIGDPIISPTPWYGLCYGTPFLNPVKTHLEDDGTTRIARSQHPFAGDIGKPHVYNVGSSDLFKPPQIDPEADDILIESLREAIDVGPRERFIPEAMKQEQMTARVKKWLETDWKAEMRVNLESETKWGSDARWKQLIM
ncbi:hypothetical protein BDY24DRAFT_379875 [Mrakia frigida]|uniref:uncharacterized protein n=1 Tax=Mrakia frigida TaxID=29902 RepID=UPI003FCC2399